MLLNKIIFKVHDKDGQDISVKTEGTIILVGPNSSGKSMALREIERYLNDGNSALNNIIGAIELEDVNDEEKAYKILKGSEVVTPGDNPPENSFFIGRENHSNGNRERFFVFTRNVQSAVEFLNRPDVKRRIAYTYVLRLDGTTRLTSLNQSGAADLLQNPIDLNSMMLRYSAKRQEVRKIIHEAFGLYMSIDVTGRSTNRVRFGEESPTESIETGVGADAIAYHTHAKSYEDAGDGLKAFSGIVANIIVSKSKIMLIDEPEAFLHPPLSYKLGEEISKIAQEREVNLIVATHSSSFLMGALQSTSKVSIVRMSFTQGIPRIKILNNEQVKHLVNNPVMRSSNVLSGIFHDGVIVTEDDSDRVLYQEINYRLSRLEKSGLASALFLNSNGKTSLHKIAGPLRLSGVPAAICADFDLVFIPVEFGNVISSANIPKPIADALHALKSNMMNGIDQNERENIKKQGINYFSGDKRAAAQEIISILNRYGVFIIPTGELESWLRTMGVEGKKVGRVIQILEKFGNDPTDDQYVRPAQGDIWDYIRSVTMWLKDPQREGMTDD